MSSGVSAAPAFTKPVIWPVVDGFTDLSAQVAKISGSTKPDRLYRFSGTGCASHSGMSRVCSDCIFEFKGPRLHNCGGNPVRFSVLVFSALELGTGHDLVTGCQHDRHDQLCGITVNCSSHSLATTQSFKQ